MKVSELIALLSELPPEHEIGMLSYRGFARPPSIEPVNRFAG